MLRGQEYLNVEVVVRRHSGIKALDHPYLCVLELMVQPPQQPPQASGSWALPPNYGLIRAEM